MQGIHAHYAQFHYIHTALELNERFTHTFTNGGKKLASKFINSYKETYSETSDRIIGRNATLSVLSLNHKNAGN